jgi:hypothetical protein
MKIKIILLIIIISISCKSNEKQNVTTNSDNIENKRYVNKQISSIIDSITTTK